MVGIMCIYAPTTPRERAIFWDRILDVLLDVDHWVVGGDFNNIESAQDYRAEIAPVLTAIAPSEQDSWGRFLLFL